MQKLLANKIFLLVLVTLLILALIVFGLLPNNPVEKVTSPVTSVLDPIQKTIRSFGNKTGSFWSVLSEGAAIKKENEELKLKIAALEYETNQAKEAALRWEELKEAFHIKENFANYEIYGASILTREADEWFNIMRINLGIRDLPQLKEEYYAVVDVKKNLVGRILSSDLNSSKVLPLFHEGFSVAAKVNTVNGAQVRIRGEVVLKEDNLCRIDILSLDVPLTVGDELITSGDGGLFPAGIPIGVVEEVDVSNPLRPLGVLRPYTDISSIRDVFVLIPMNETLGIDSVFTE